MADQHINLVDHTDDETSPPPSSPPGTQPSQNPATPNPDSHIDILYENQRGWFIFGIPLFSSKALWNLRIDQSPWVDSAHKPSAVNITNAQVPDPSWVWEWKSWYVDMSRDVDEEGWQYSLWFKGAAWHGSHPWFHSFVRRRRWLRKRVKLRLPKRDEEGKRERLFGDAFSVGTTLARTSTVGPVSLQDDGSERVNEEDEEIRDVGTLMRRLKESAIDREKIGFIMKFVSEGGEELLYLADQIPAIMSMLIFQNSRRQLLSRLLSTFDEAKEYQEEHKQSDEPENETEEWSINSLLKVVEAAEAECKKLEYYSDIRKLTEEGDIGIGNEPVNEKGEDHEEEAEKGSSVGQA